MPYPQKPSSTTYSKISSPPWSRAAVLMPETAVRVTATRTRMPTPVVCAVDPGSRVSPATRCSPASPASWITAEPVTAVVFARNTTEATMFTQPVMKPSQGLSERPTHT